MENNKLIKVTPDDILKNNGKKGKPFWICMHNKVYDVTLFTHPGGKDIFIVEDDDDVDKGDEFDTIHAPSTRKEAEKYLIGELFTPKQTIEPKKLEIKNSSGNGAFIVFVFFLVLVIIIVRGGYLSDGQEEHFAEN